MCVCVCVCVCMCARARVCANACVNMCANACEEEERGGGERGGGRRGRGNGGAGGMFVRMFVQCSNVCSMFECLFNVGMFVQCWNVCSKQTEGNHSQELEAADIGGRAGRGMEGRGRP